MQALPDHAILPHVKVFCSPHFKDRASPPLLDWLLVEEVAPLIPLALARAGFKAFFMRILRLKLCAAAARMTASVKSVGLKSTLAKRWDIHWAMLGRGGPLQQCTGVS